MAEIILGNVVVHANVGVSEHERLHKQPVKLNARVEYFASRAIRRDSFEHALDYGQFLRMVHEAANEKRFHLLESLADHVAWRVLKRFRTAKRVVVEASKPRVNVRKHARIAVRVERRR